MPFTGTAEQPLDSTANAGFASKFPPRSKSAVARMRALRASRPMSPPPSKADLGSSRSDAIRCLGLRRTGCIDPALLRLLRAHRKHDRRRRMAQAPWRGWLRSYSSRAAAPRTFGSLPNPVLQRLTLGSLGLALCRFLFTLADSGSKTMYGGFPSIFTAKMSGHCFHDMFQREPSATRCTPDQR